MEIAYVKEAIKNVLIWYYDYCVINMAWMPFNIYLHYSENDISQDN